MSLRNQVLSGVFWTALQQFSRQGITFVVSVILARLLLPEEFGLIAMIGILINLGTALINSGLTQSLIRTQDADQSDYSTVFYFNLVGSVVIYGIIYFCAPLVADFYSQPRLTQIVRLYSITFIINAFSAIQTTRLSKILDFKTQMKVAIPSLILGSATGIIMALNGFGVWSLVWSGIIQSLAATIQLWYWSKWAPSLIFNMDKFRYHFNYGVKLMVTGVMNILFSSAYTIIIGRYFAASQVAFYNRAETLQMLPVVNINLVLNRITFTLFSSIQNDDIKLRSAYKKIMQMVIFLVAPTLIVMAVLAEPLFILLFTEKWLPAVPYFQILCANGILYPIHEYNLQIVVVKGRSDLYLKLEIAKKILIVLVILASFPFGIFGLLYGSVIASTISFFINTHYSGKFINYTAWDQIKDLLPFVFLALIAGLGSGIVNYLLEFENFNNFSRLLAGSIVAVIIYLSSSYLLKLPAILEVIRLIRSQLGKVSTV